MSNKNRFLTIVLGAAALAGLTYGVTRRGQQRRAVQPSASQVLAASESSAAREADAQDFASDWETLTVHGQRRSTPDALDVAMNLDGIFDGGVEEELAVTARPSDRVPPPLGGDDEEAPGADDLGRAWLAQATQSEHSARESDLVPEVEEIAFADEPNEEEADADEPDEHEDFYRTRA